MVDLISPPGSYTPEQEEELRAYGRAMGAMDLGQTRDMMGAGSPWRVLLGAVRGLQQRSAMDSVEGNRSGRRQRQALAIPGVVSMSPGTFTVQPPGAEGQPPPEQPPIEMGGVQWGQPGQPVAIRFHNPGAIEFGPFAQQFGARPGRDNPRYAEFDSPETGFRAMHALLNNYMRRGRRTLQSILSEWAPSPENDVPMYIRRVATAMGIPESTQLTPADIPRLAIAMFGVESGVNLAGARAPVTPPITPVQASAGAPVTPPITPVQASASAPPSVAAPLTASASAPSSVDTGAVGGGEVPVRRVPTIPIEAPPGTDIAPEGTDVEQPGYFSDRYTNVPRRIAVNPALIALLQRFRDPNAMSQADWQAALAEYQKLAAPVEVQTTYGKATYNPLTGELQDFVPSGIIRRPVTTPGGTSTEQLLAPSATAGGFSVAPIAPTPGLGGDSGVRASASASRMSPLLTPDLPPFPDSGSISDIAEWGMQANAIRQMIDKMAETQAGQLSTARLAGERATRRIQQLQSIAALRQLAEAQGFNATGDALSRLQTRVAQFLINLDPRSRDERPGFLNNLSAREVLNKLNAFLASEATQDISARGTNFEFATLLQNNPNLASSFEGTMMLLSYMIQEQQHIQTLARNAGRFSHRTGDWNSVVENFYKQNPIIINIPSINGSPAQRITTARIPLPGELREDGTPWTNEQISRHIRETVSPGTFFINPRTGRLSLVPPVSTPTTAPR